MSSLNSDVTKSVRNLITYIQETTKRNLVAAQREGKVSLEAHAIEQVANLVESSISQAYTNGYIEIETTLKKYGK